MMTRYNVRFIDKSLSGDCHLTRSCQRDLKVLSGDNGLSLDNCRNIFSARFCNAYKNDRELASADAFVFTYSLGMSEIFMAFNRTIIIIACTRFQTGRYSKEAFSAWVESVRLLAKHPNNIIAANNEYDRQYMKFFTGVEVELLPSYCGYTNAAYNPSRHEFLVGPSRSLNSQLYAQLKPMAKAKGLTVAAIREIYAHYEFSDLAQHPGIIFFPYQVGIGQHHPYNSFICLDQHHVDLRIL